MFKYGTTQKITNLDRKIENYIEEKDFNNHVVDLAWEEFTDMEAAIAMWLMSGYTPVEIQEHFEIDRREYFLIKESIKSKLAQAYTEADNDE